MCASQAASSPDKFKGLNIASALLLSTTSRTAMS